MHLKIQALLSHKTNDMNHFYFFSYDSNLLFERIQERTPSVELVQAYRLDQFELVFNKLSKKDGSTKANISPSNQSNVYGVIQRIDAMEKAALDRAEGLGYGYELDFFNLFIDDKKVEIGYYIAKDSKYLAIGKPYDWYLEFVIFGAHEDGFPLEYQQQIKSVEYVIDQNAERRKEPDLLLAKYR